MKELKPQTNVADPGSGAFLIPGSETHIIESLVTIFWVKSTILLSELNQIFSLLIFHFVKFEATNSSHPTLFLLLLMLVWDPGSGIYKSQDLQHYH
jgi:hypothetical protein